MPKKKIKAKRQPTSFTAILRSRAFTIFVIFGIIVIAISFTKEIIRKVEIQKQVSELEQEIALLEQQNAEFTDLMQYFNSSAFQEKEARRKLGMRQDGETVVIIPNDGTQPQTATELADAQQSGTVSNVTRWKNYFFN